jgi:RNA polymerase sigma factor (sigma-70 family)
VRLNRIQAVAGRRVARRFDASVDLTHGIPVPPFPTVLRFFQKMRPPEPLSALILVETHSQRESSLMATGPLGAVLGHLRQWAGAGDGGELTDAQLLERFARRHEEAAFAALVRRHGPMVWGVCRRLLGNAHDAEDAFQATFLILVRRVAAIHRGQALGCWLHQVARRTALRARADRDSRRRHERECRPTHAPDFIAAVAWRDLQPLLDEEVGRLPDKYQAPFVLCYLEGTTYAEAAHRLRCRRSAVAHRLARARELLRSRLARRGLDLPAGVLAAALGTHAADAALPATLAAATVQAALTSAAGGAAAGVSPRLAVLVEGGLQAMRTTARTITLTVLLTAGLLAAGFGLFARSTPAGPPEGGARTEAEPAPAPRALAEAPRGMAEKRPPGKTMTVTGRVVGADDQPVPGARVAVVAGPFGRASISGRFHDRPLALGQTRTGRDGHFRLRVPRTSADRHYRVMVLAAAEGHGLGQGVLDADARRHEVRLRLAPEQSVPGRLITLAGVPAAGVRVRVARLHQGGRDVLRSNHDVPDRWTAWPGAVTTDRQGRLVLRGLAAGMGVTLRVDDDRFACQTLDLVLPARGRPREFTWSLTPAQLLTGRVVRADTGQPVPRARVAVKTLARFGGQSGVYRVHGPVEGRADAGGRFRLNPIFGDVFQVTAFAPSGQPYLSLTETVQQPKARAKREIEIRLPRGVLVHGQVKEAGSGKAVAGAEVRFLPRQLLSRNDAHAEGWRVPAVSGPDGRFALAVRPGPGHLLAQGPTPDYIHAEVSRRQLEEQGQAGGQRFYPDAVLALDLKPETRSYAMDIRLRRGVTLRGRVVGPDGKPVARAVMYCVSQIPPLAYTYPGRPVPMRGGRFALRGCDPGKAVRVFFLAAGAKLGAVAELSAGKARGEPVKVRLGRCGSAVARFRDKRGQPLKDYSPNCFLVLTPGILLMGEPVLDRRLGADVADPWPSGRPATDASGRLTFTALIPGATYWITDWDNGHVVKKAFTVAAGQAVDLKDITVAAPR